MTPTPVVDPYTVLGIDPQVTLDEIKKAYFALVREHPPERDPEGFKRIRAAYEQVRDPDKRLETDMLRLQEWPEPAWEKLFDELEAGRTQDLALDPADVIIAARALSDLGRRDFREDFREVNA